MRLFRNSLAVVIIAACCAVQAAVVIPSCINSQADMAQVAPKPEPVRSYPLDDGRWIDVKGKVISQPDTTPPQTANPKCSPEPHKDAASGNMGFVLEGGVWAVLPQFKHARPFKEGRAVVTLPLSGNAQQNTQQSTCSYITLDGQQLKQRFQTCGDFNNGVAYVVKSDDTFAMINLNGDDLIENTQAARWNHATATMSAGLIALLEQDSGKVGYANGKGEWVIKPQFAQGFEHHEGLAAVAMQEDGKIGFIDRQGRVVLPFKYGSNAGDPPFFKANRALLAKDNDWPRTNLDAPAKLGFIDKNGRWIIAPKYSGGKSFSGELAHMYIGDKEYYIDLMGRQVWPKK